MARTRTTIRRIDPWSILKFGFVANLVLLGIELLAGLVVWYVIQRLELIQTVCELAATVGFEECGVDGGALFDTFLVLGLLGIVIQTGIMVFLTFLANLIFDLTGGIVVTLEDDRGPARASRASGVGARATGAAAISRGGSGGSGRDSGGSRREAAGAGASTGGDAGRRQDATGRIGPASGESSQVPIGSGGSPSDPPADPPAGPGGGGGNDDTLFGNR